MNDNYFSIVLHAHMPYIRHSDAKKIEQRWLFEVISETYIPLIWMLEKQRHKQILTLSFSAPLMEMLTDTLSQNRYIQYLDKTEELLEKEERFVVTVEEKRLVTFYKKRVKRLRETFHKWEKNLLLAFRYYSEKKMINCICTTASHAFLPYLLTNEAVNAQIIHGIETFSKYFGVKPRGFWLPECGFTPGIDQTLYDHGIVYTFVDEHAIQNIDETFHTPVVSPYGITLFPRNSLLSNQIWNSVIGYPGDFDYREYYRDIAFERKWDYLQSVMEPHDIRVSSGLKYYRITGITEEKQFYNRENALAKVKEHSKHFLELVKKQFQEGEKNSKTAKMAVIAFDAELFGHWWFEGPNWLNQLIAEASKEFIVDSFDGYIVKYDHQFKKVNAIFSSWGRNHYGEVWLNEQTSWIYSKLHKIELDLRHLITQYYLTNALNDRCLKQMVREWMLAVSSDWAFMIDAKSTVQYATDRLNEHFLRFNNLKEKLLNNQLNESSLNEYEAEYPFLENILLEVFILKDDEYVINRQNELWLQSNKKVLMFAWEFPPLVVGGLSRHVFYLSKALVLQGYEVHVITTAVEESPEYEIVDGIIVYRVQSLLPNCENFYDWVGSLNIAFIDFALHLTQQIKFDLIHAHDWLVCVAACSLKKQLEIPLIATIHATEHGRNNGIHNELQQQISQKELELCTEANHVIVCSQYMNCEVKKLFTIPKDKITIIPNGVNELKKATTNKNWKHKFGKENDIFVFSIGRMVKEKGYQTLIDAVPIILVTHPNVKFIIAGKGPMLKDYRKQVIQKQLGKSIYFIGFIEDDYRNQILHDCDFCLFPSYYEPFGIVALEGMITGKPTIVTEIGGLDEIITHKVNGLKMMPNDVESLTNELISCIEDKKLAKTIAENGKRLAKTKYSWESVAVNTIAVYESVMR